jgi:chromosome segregation ATPase
MSSDTAKKILGTPVLKVGGMRVTPKNKILSGKTLNVREFEKQENSLKTICKKHQVGNLTFKSCKFATADGKVTYVDHKNILSNMKCGVMLIKTSSADESKDAIYDIVKIENEKKERDLKKHQEETEKARLEIERLQKASNPNPSDDTTKDLLTKYVNTLPEKETKSENDVIPMETINHFTETVDQLNETSNQFKDAVNEFTEAVNQLKETVNQQIDTVSETKEFINETKEPVSETKEPVNETKEPVDETKEPVSETKEPVSETKEPVSETKEPIAQSKRQSKKDKSTKAKRDKYVKEMREQLEKKSEKKDEGNKYQRHLMQDIKSKFTLEPITKYKYLEVKAETTDMVIDGAKVFKIKMPSVNNQNYYLVVGDLQMKSGLIYRIDPNYKSEKTFKGYDEFLERIKAKESTKVREMKEDLLEEEFDDLEHLGISDDDIEPKEKPLDPTDPPKEILDLMNPEISKLVQTQSTEDPIIDDDKDEAPQLVPDSQPKTIQFQNPDGTTEDSVIVTKSMLENGIFSKNKSSSSIMNEILDKSE